MCQLGFPGWSRVGFLSWRVSKVVQCVVSESRGFQGGPVWGFWVEGFPGWSSVGFLSRGVSRVGFLSWRVSKVVQRVVSESRGFQGGPVWGFWVEGFPGWSSVGFLSWGVSRVVQGGVSELRTTLNPINHSTLRWCVLLKSYLMEDKYLLV